MAKKAVQKNVAKNVANEKKTVRTMNMYRERFYKFPDTFYGSWG